MKFDNPEAGVEQRRLCKNYSEKYNNGCPIFKETTEYGLPFRKSSKTHGAKCTVTQFPLRLAWGLTGHKMQGLTLKAGSDLVCHGYEKRTIPSLYYVMLSRCEDINNVYISENFEIEKIQCNKEAMVEMKNLDERCIASEKRLEKFDIFMVNVRSLSKHLIELQHDTAAMNSNYMCLVETWINPELDQKYAINGRQFTHGSFGKGKGVAIFSKVDEKIYGSNQSITSSYQVLSLRIKGDFQIILIYVSKGCQFEQLVNDMKKIFLPGLHQIVIGDMNFDAEEQNCFVDYLNSMGFVQMVNQATHKDGRILDHCYVQQSIEERVSLCLKFPHYTDHASLCMCITLE